MLPQIEAFLEVARRQNLSRAAEALFVSQPTLTARLQSLDKTLCRPGNAEIGELLTRITAGFLLKRIQFRADLSRILFNVPSGLGDFGGLRRDNTELILDVSHC